MKLIETEDRLAINRIRHNVGFLSARRGMLAVTVDIPDAERLLNVIARLGTEINRLKMERSGPMPDRPWPRG